MLQSHGSNVHNRSVSTIIQPANPVGAQFSGGVLTGAAFFILNFQMPDKILFLAI